MVPLPRPATRCPAADARRWSSCRPRCRLRVQRTARALEELMSCQSACGAHAQMGRPVRVQLAGAFAHAPLTWRHAILTRLGSGERRCATRGRLRTPSMCLRVVRAGPFGCAFTSRCGSLWGARATRADQQCVSVHARESHIVCATCTNEFRVRPTGRGHTLGVRTAPTRARTDPRHGKGVKSGVI